MTLNFSARIISGSGIAKKQNVPTLNLFLEDIPDDLEEGIYACKVSLQEPGTRNQELGTHPTVMHYGPRPVHHLPLSCEVHILDQVIEHPPESVFVEIAGRIRDVQDFSDPKELQEAIQSDLAQARAILAA
jgi:FAD synthase